MNPHVERANVLLSQHRVDLAAQELRQALAQDPDDAFAHALLAICLSSTDRKAEALEEARLAVRHAPDQGFPHYVTACVLESLGRMEQAHEAIAQAIRLDPYDADFFEKQGFIFAHQDKWEQALAAARQGLAIDAEHVDCLNLQGLALTHLGRGDEARRSAEDSLTRDPQNAFSHASMGWTLLHQAKHKEALEHFREALRLNPNMEYARSGLLAALKANYLVYRLMLMFFLWMSRLGAKSRWGVILAIFVLSRFARGNLLLLSPLLLFVYLSWTADPLFNLLLRLNKYGRSALSRNQIIASNLVGAFLAGALASLGAALWLNMDILLSLALVLGVLVIPIAGTFACSGRKRLVLAACTVALLGVGTAELVLMAMGRAEWKALSGIFLVGVFLFTLLANVSFKSGES